jgi:Rab-like protein 2
MDEYNPRQLSTYALTLYRKMVNIDGQDGPIKVDFWDTAGQERFSCENALTCPMSCLDQETY